MDIVSVCMRCGCPLEITDIAMSVRGHYICWDERREGEGVYTYCKECMGIIEQWQKEGIRGADRRWSEANVNK